MFVAEHHPHADETVLFLHGGNVAGWMWRDLAATLPDHHCLIPDLPGFGASRTRPWTTLEAVADAVAEIVRARAHDGRAHVVGLSLGAVVGTVLLARHPDVAASALLTGAPLRGVGRATRAAGLVQLRCWVRGRTGACWPAATGCPPTRSPSSSRRAWPSTARRPTG
ncbi:alpha/beta fold hydrolase [Asanoa siamensis]|uniref:AB hydrolase-1 domain-containing protein n=1 Tax=Asanoa siamensis TaxID=926357 RepID=A0ABQ4CQM2_9ACTN|nr:alpha/beta fold hydrolase [Asanoa siamensis]GIF73603.1 hypothetical protein Asi02nite_31210 [Asanoa siamensis]